MVLDYMPENGTKISFNKHFRLLYFISLILKFQLFIVFYNESNVDYVW